MLIVKYSGFNGFGQIQGTESELKKDVCEPRKMYETSSHEVQVFLSWSRIVIVGKSIFLLYY